MLAGGGIMTRSAAKKVQAPLQSQFTASIQPSALMKLSKIHIGSAGQQPPSRNPVKKAIAS
jgi:hypothetical protein